MMQQARWSLIETVTSTAVGFGLTAIAQPILFHLYGIQVSAGTQFQLVVWFTILSILRGYGLRRFFNWIHKKGIGNDRH